MEGLLLKFCRHCGEEIKGYGAFCWKCGADLQKEDSNEDTEVVGESEDAVDVDTEEPTGDSDDDSSGDPGEAAPKEAPAEPGEDAAAEGTAAHSEADDAEQAEDEVSSAAGQGGLGGGISNRKGPSRAGSNTNAESRAKKPKRPLSKMAKVLLSAGLFLAVVLIGGYVYGASVYSKEKVADRFKDAVMDGDAKALGKLLYA